mgnify:CR=1 FL=1
MQPEIIQKYNRPVPRYTSYPPANYFGEFSETDYLCAVNASDSARQNQISFYLHIPFCRHLCHYCGCNSYPAAKPETVEAYVEGLALPASVQLAFSKENEEIQWSQVPEEVSYEVYRIMQELLSNILKHSGATEIDVTLTLKRKLLTLQISNNGKNYCGDEVRGKGIGLTTIQERAKAVGGLFTTDIQDRSQKFKLEISLSI